MQRTGQRSRGRRRVSTEVFGYQLEPQPDMAPDFSLFGKDLPFPLGGMGRVAAATPPNWLACFGVDDVDDAEEAVTANGGSVVVPARDLPFRRQALVADPEGATFMLAEIDVARQPDRSG